MSNFDWIPSGWTEEEKQALERASQPLTQEERAVAEELLARCRRDILDGEES